MHFVEFVCLIAFLMVLTALSVDIMLPSLPEMERSLQIGGENDRQLIITFYLVGLAAGQLFAGPLSDRYGRRGPLFVGLFIFAIGSTLAIFATSASVMYAARILQGLGAAAPRVLAIAIVRDRFAGRQMARVMSFVIMTFIIIPILAPSIGQGITQFASWNWLFVILLAFSLVTIVWVWLRLPETCPPDSRLPLSPSRIGDALRQVITTPQTVGYAVGFGFFFGTLLSYVASSEQIFVEIYGLKESFPIVFGAVASVMIVASMLNARLVGWLGMRRVSHSALLGYVAVCAVVTLFGYPEEPPLIVFCLYIAVTFFCFGLIGPNFNALAMEPVGHIAGTASSAVGFYTTGAGALFGWMVGQSFDGTVRPLMIGFTLLACLTLITVLITERGKLAQSHH